MVTAAALGVAIAAAVLFLVELLSSYPSLPATVPLHFDLAGNPGEYGPRWLLPALLVLVEIVLLAGFIVPARMRHLATPGFVAPVILAASAAFVTYLQHLIFRVALGQDRRLARSFWIALVALMSVCVGVTSLGR